MSPGFTTTILSASRKPKSGRDYVNKDQLDSTKKDQLEKWWWWFSWINDGVLLTEYLPRGTTINGLCYASMIERLYSVIVEKGRGEVSRGVVLLHDNAPIDKCKIVQAAIEEGGLIELNDCAYSLYIASFDSYLLSNVE